MQFKSRKVVLTTLCLVALGLPNFSWALDEFNLHISAGISPNTLLYRFTKEKGFYREEGLEVLPIQAGMLPGIQGLVAGKVFPRPKIGRGGRAGSNGGAAQNRRGFLYAPAD